MVNRTVMRATVSFDIYPGGSARPAREERISFAVLNEELKYSVFGTYASLGVGCTTLPSVERLRTYGETVFLAYAKLDHPQREIRNFVVAWHA